MPPTALSYANSAVTALALANCAISVSGVIRFSPVYVTALEPAATGPLRRYASFRSMSAQL